MLEQIALTTFNSVEVLDLLIVDMLHSVLRPLRTDEQAERCHRIVGGFKSDNGRVTDQKYET